VADPYADGLARARAALGAPARPRRAATPATLDLRTVPAADPGDDDGPPEDPRDARIAELEAEVRALRAALAQVHDAARAALDP